MPNMQGNREIRRSWLQRARKYQETLQKSLSDRQWDSIEVNQLDKRIGFAIYGSEYFLTDNDDRNKHITAIRDHIIKLSDIDNCRRIYISCVFVYLGYNVGGEIKDLQQVLFKIPKKKDFNNVLYIDENCRTYNGWKDYFCNNKLPECYMCFPSNGVYSTKNGLTEIIVKPSSAYKFSNGVVKVLDKSSLLLSIGALGVSVTSLFLPVATPLLLAATSAVVGSGVYDIGRSINTLVDRVGHKESVSLNNPESREAWFGLASNAVFIGSKATLLKKTGVAASRDVLKSVGKGKSITRVLTAPTIVLSSLNVLNSLVTNVCKFINGTLTPHDIKKFVLACNLFLNAIVTRELAGRFIEDAASVDRTFLCHLTVSSDFTLVKTVIKFAEYSSFRNFMLSESYNIMYTKIKGVYTSAKSISYLIQQVSNGSIGWMDFFCKVSKELDSFLLLSGASITKSVSMLKQQFRIDLKSCFASNYYGPAAVDTNVKLVADSFSEIGNLIEYCNLPVKTNKHHFYGIAQLVNDFCNEFEIRNCSDYLNKTKFFCDYIKEEFDNIRRDSKCDTDLDEMSVMTDVNNFEIMEFQDEYKNLGFFHKIIIKLKDKDAFAEISRRYETCGKSSCNEEPYFTAKSCQIYFFNGRFGMRNLTDSYYWQKVKDFTEGSLNKNNSILLPKGDSVVCHPKDNNNIKVVVFYSKFDEDYNRVLGNVLVVSK